MMELIEIDTGTLLSYLADITEITGEYEILKKFTPVLKGDGTPYSMYERHFSVYHALYKLKMEAGKSGLYLHIDPVKIRLLNTPGPGFCGWYYPEKGSFCMNESSGPYCSIHKGEIEPDIPYFDPMAQFYLDPENISFGESALLHEVMKGFRIYFIHKREINEALAIFSIEKPGKKAICRRYRELAALFHPDRCGGSDEKMKVINSAYSLLKTVYVV